MNDYLKFTRGDNINNYRENLSLDASWRDYLFFDTSNHVMYLNGYSYGITSDEKDIINELSNNCFISVDSEFDEISKRYNLLFTRFGGTSRISIGLFNIQSGSPVIDVSYIPESSCYNIDLKVNSSSDNIITKTESGLSAVVKLRMDGSILSAVNSNGDILGDSVNLGDFSGGSNLSGILSNVYIDNNPVDISGNIHSGKTLVFTLKNAQGVIIPEDTIYVDINSLFNINYHGYNGISVDNINGDVSLLLKSDDRYLKIDPSGNLSSGDLHDDIIDISSRVNDLSLNGFDKASVVGADTDKWNNADPSLGNQTIWAVKNYVDSSIDNISGIDIPVNTGSEIVIDASQENGIVTQKKTSAGNIILTGFNDFPDVSNGNPIEDGDSMNKVLKKIQYAISWESIS